VCELPWMRSNRLIKSGKHYRYLLHLKSGHEASNRCGVWSQLCLGGIATEPMSPVNKSGES